MDHWGVLGVFLAVVILSGCIIGESATNSQNTSSNDDEFIKQYLKDEMAKGKTTTTQPIEYEDAKKTQQASTTTTTVPRIPCPYVCCNDTVHQAKGCGEWFVCENNTCNDRPCPFECCVMGMYADKECAQPLECVNSTCQKLPCPEEYECCNASDYIGGGCNPGFECVNNACAAKDSDGDGLADVVEANLGTNSNVSDTDGDSLTDYEEAKIYKTDPLKRNTDADRYPDNVDRRPLQTDSAYVNMTVAETRVMVDYPIIKELQMYLYFGQPKPGNDSIIADFESFIWIANTGTDYTSYVNYTYSR